MTKLRFKDGKLCINVPEPRLLAREFVVIVHLDGLKASDVESLSKASAYASEVI